MVFSVSRKKSPGLCEGSPDRPSLQRWLPYEAYDPETHLFHNVGSIGWGLQLTPSTGATAASVTILASILTDVLPPDADVQVLMWASPWIGPAIQGVREAAGQRGAACAHLADKQAAYLERGAFHSLSRASDMLLRDFKLYCFFSVSKTHRDANSAALLRYREDTMSSLRSVPIDSRVCAVQDFLVLMNAMLNPRSSLEPPSVEWNPYTALSAHMTEDRIEVRPRSLVFHGDSESPLETQCFTVKQFPSAAAQWNMHDLLGSLFNGALQIPCPFVISLSFRIEDPDKSQTRVQSKLVFQDSKARSPLTKWLPRLARENEAWQVLRERLSEGDRLTTVLYQVMLMTDAETMPRAERKLRDLYQSQGWKLRSEPFLQLPLFLGILPWMMSEGLYADLQCFHRFHRMTAFNTVNIMPLQGEWKGTGSPLMLLPGRRGQVSWWDPFANDGNYNIAIAAKSRSGKSVLMQAYITALVGSGGRCWVIDIGHSYEKTCRLLDGVFVECRLDAPQSLNPFSGIQQFDEALPMLLPLIGSMARPKTSTSEEEDATLEAALIAVWQQEGRGASITSVRDYLARQSDPVSQNLAHLLVSYAAGGMYAPFFDGPSTVPMDNPFIVFELLGLKDKPDLQRMVLLTLMTHVHHAMYLTGRSQRKSCLIDEAWSLLGADTRGAAKFIETGYRTSARHNGNFISITQSLGDYYQSASAKAAFQNADWKIILAQTPEAIRQAKEQGYLQMDAFLEKLLLDIRKVEGAYSECVIISPQGYGIHRIPLDPYTRILFSSKGPEVDAVKAWEAQGIPLSEAVERVARQYYPEQNAHAP